MDTTYAQFQNWANAYIGNDGKMYIANWNVLGKGVYYIRCENVVRKVVVE